jgi:hypothetical protein
VLVDRGTRAVDPRYVGRTLATAEVVQVLVREEDGRRGPAGKARPTTAPRSAGPRPRAVPKERGTKDPRATCDGQETAGGKAISARPCGPGELPAPAPARDRAARPAEILTISHRGRCGRS